MIIREGTLLDHYKKHKVEGNGQSVAHTAKISEKWEVKGDRRSASGERSIMSVPSVWWFESLPNAVE
ncbi:hypothetical protein [Tychonema sp. LEGE 07203]|uniref:hypothetical protein n=1 Tax=Tychonema sp. LEGE 07203 TaxID=1828671 RepID=UPI00187F21AC|nr:hypothetical protein [Tychonema sp. LEGE 07203]MBE9092438.1 hypothetical protein [Tychonema sp. LEGE 07203]